MSFHHYEETMENRYLNTDRPFIDEDNGKSSLKLYCYIIVIT